MNSWKQILPAPVQDLARALYYPLYRILVRLWCLAHRVGDLRARSDDPDLPLPPPFLRFKVGGTPSPKVFLETGRECASTLSRLLDDLGPSLQSEAPLDVLDFGCGSGRTLIWLARRFPAHRYHGADTDTEAIAWSRDNLSFGRFLANRPEPPLPFPAATFDLIYAVSVFTHLEWSAQKTWLAELARLVKSDGTLILTVHGETVWSQFSPEKQERIRQEGTVTFRSRKLQGIFPDWYQTTCHTEEFVTRACSRHFQSVSYLREGMGYLDVVACREPYSDP